MVGQLGATALFAAKFRENAARSLLLPKRRPGSARRSGSSASAPPTCWRSRRATGRSRSCSRRTANACATSSTCRRSSSTLTDVAQPPDPRRDRRLRDAVALRRVAALQLRRQLHLRRRRAARRTARAGAGGRSGAAARADRRRRTARAARRRCHRRASSASFSGSTRTIGEERGRRPRPAAGPRRSDRARSSRARSTARGRRARRAYRCARRAIALKRGRRTAVRCRRRRRPLPRRRSASPLPRGIPDALLDAGRRSARRPGAALRAHARAVHRRATSPSRYGLADRRRRGAARPAHGRGPRSSRANSAPADTAASGPMPASCAMCAGARWRSCVTKSSRSSRRRSAASRRRGRASSTAAKGADALLDAIEQLQGAPLPASILETEILPARVDGYNPADLDAVIAAGEVVWVGVEPLGDRDGRVALYLADHLRRCAAGARSRSQRRTIAEPRARSAAISTSARAARRSSGRCTKRPAADTHGETVDALWNLVWRGLVTNDTFHALRAFTRGARAAPRGRAAPTPRPSDRGGWRRRQPKGAGRSSRAARRPRATDDALAAPRMAQQLLARHGVLTREGGGRGRSARRLFDASTRC